MNLTKFAVKLPLLSKPNFFSWKFLTPIEINFTKTEKKKHNKIPFVKKLSEKILKGRAVNTTPYAKLGQSIYWQIHRDWDWLCKYYLHWMIEHKRSKMKGMMINVDKRSKILNEIKPIKNICKYS